MLDELFEKITKGLKGMAGDYGAALAADWTRDWLKGKSGSRTRAVLDVDDLAQAGNHQEAYNKLLAMFRNSSDRDEEVLLQDSMTVYAQRARFRVKKADVLSWFRFLARLPEEYRNRLRFAHVTELDDNARLHKLARLMMLKSNKDRTAALVQAGIMHQSQVGKFLDALTAWDNRFARGNRRLDTQYRATRNDIRQANIARQNRTLFQRAWDIVRPRPFI